MSARADMAGLDDAALLHRVLAREGRAWREFIRRFDPALREVVHAATESSDFDDGRIDDVIGDLWLALCETDMQRLRAYDRTRGLPLVAWLAAQATRVAMKHMRRLAREPEFVPLADVADLADARSLDPEAALLTTAEAARYCGYRTTGALRKAAMLGRVRAVGRRGGTGTSMWRRGDLDHFLSGGRTGIVAGGLAGNASAHEGGTDEQVDHALGNHNRGDAFETRRLAHEGGRLSDPVAGDDSAHRTPQGSSNAASRGRERGGSVSGSAATHRRAPHRRRPVDIDSVIRGIREVSLRAKDRQSRNQKRQES